MEKNGLFLGLGETNGPAAWVKDNRLIPFSATSSAAVATPYPETGFSDFALAVESFSDSIRATVAPYVQAMQPGEARLRGAIRDLERYLSGDEVAPPPSVSEAGDSNPFQRSPVALALDNSRVQEFTATITDQVRGRMRTQGRGAELISISNPSETVAALVRAKMEQVAVEQDPGRQNGLAGGGQGQLYGQIIALQADASRKKMDKAANIAQGMGGSTARMAARMGMVARAAERMGGMLDKIAAGIKEVTSHSPRAYYRLARIKTKRFLRGMGKRFLTSKIYTRFLRKFMALLNARPADAAESPVMDNLVSLALKDQKPQAADMEVEAPRPAPAFVLKRVSRMQPIVNRADIAIRESRALREQHPFSGSHLYRDLKPKPLYVVRSSEDADVPEEEINRDMVTGRSTVQGYQPEIR
jgi:hypothetical protein